MKTVAGYEGRYSVTEDGRVWSHRFKKYLRPLPTRPGYVRVALTNDRGKITYHLIHRLVCQAFVGDVENLTVNHINGVKTDNRAENLEPATYGENALHAYLTGLKGYIDSNKNGKLSGSGNGRSKLSENDVREIRERAKTRKRGQRLWDEFGISKVTFYGILRRKLWAHI